MRNPVPCAQEGGPQGLREKPPPMVGYLGWGAPTREEEHGQGQHHRFHPEGTCVTWRRRGSGLKGAGLLCEEPSAPPLILARGGGGRAQSGRGSLYPEPPHGAESATKTPEPEPLMPRAGGSRPPHLPRGFQQSLSGRLSRPIYVSRQGLGWEADKPSPGLAASHWSWRCGT